MIAQVFGQELFSKQKDIDVLIIHNPPYEILDESIGCKTLIKIVKEINTKLLIFGHMHSCSDSKEIHNKIQFFNNCTSYLRLISRFCNSFAYTYSSFANITQN